MVRLAGLEPTTTSLEGRCSIQLSYRRNVCQQDPRFYGGFNIGGKSKFIPLPTPCSLSPALSGNISLTSRPPAVRESTLAARTKPVNMAITKLLAASP